MNEKSDNKLSKLINGMFYSHLLGIDKNKEQKWENAFKIHKSMIRTMRKTDNET